MKHRGGVVRAFALTLVCCIRGGLVEAARELDELASDFPSDMPSDYPSDIPSNFPSSAASLFPSPAISSTPTISGGTFFENELFENEEVDEEVDEETLPPTSGILTSTPTSSPSISEESLSQSEEDEEEEELPIASDVLSSIPTSPPSISVDTFTEYEIFGHHDRHDRHDHGHDRDHGHGQTYSSKGKKSKKSKKSSSGKKSKKGKRARQLKSRQLHLSFPRLRLDRLRRIDDRLRRIFPRSPIVSIFQPDAVTAVPSDAPSVIPSDAPSVVPSDAPSVVPSDAPSMVPSDAPSMVPSDAPSVVPSDAPSMMPSDAPSMVPSDAPSMVPSDAPSAVPSDAPSMMPSDAPSMVPSDTPSMTPSDVPSTSPSSAPSDYPSVVPSRWTDTQYALPEGFEVCGLSEAVDFDSLHTITVSYLYELNIFTTSSITTVQSQVDTLINQEILDSTCHNAADRYSDVARAHAISTEISGMPAEHCGPNCFIMLGRVSLLVDPASDEEYKRIYCETYQVVHDSISEETITLVPGAARSVFLRDTPMLSAECTFTEGRLAAEVEAQTASDESNISLTVESDSSLPVWAFAAGIGSVFVAVAGAIAYKFSKNKEGQNETTDEDISQELTEP